MPIPTIEIGIRAMNPANENARARGSAKAKRYLLSIGGKVIP